MAERSTTLGQRLVDLKTRSGLTLDAIATKAGYSGRSSVQRLFNPRYDSQFIHPAVVQRLKDAFVGLGTPPITSSDLDDLAAYEVSKAETVELLRSADYIPIVRLVRAKTRLKNESGQTAPVCVFKEVKATYVRPVEFTKATLLAVQIDVGYMSPRYLFGDIIFVDLAGVSSQSHDVLISLDEEEDGNELMLIGRMMEITDRIVTFFQYDPAETYTVSRERIIDIFPIIPAAQLLPLNGRDPSRSLTK